MQNKDGHEITYKNFLSTSNEKEKVIKFYQSNIDKNKLRIIGRNNF